MFHCLCSFHTQHSGHIVNIVWLQNVWAKYTHLHCNGNSGYLAGGSNHTFHVMSPSQASSSASLSLNYPNCLFIREYLLIMQFGASRPLTIIIFLMGPIFIHMEIAIYEFSYECFNGPDQWSSWHDSLALIGVHQEVSSIWRRVTQIPAVVCKLDPGSWPH